MWGVAFWWENYRLLNSTRVEILSNRHKNLVLLWKRFYCTPALNKLWDKWIIRSNKGWERVKTRQKNINFKYLWHSYCCHLPADWGRSSTSFAACDFLFEDWNSSDANLERIRVQHRSNDSEIHEKIFFLNETMWRSRLDIRVVEKRLKSKSTISKKISSFSMY